METRIIEIDLLNLEVVDYDNGRTYKIVSENGSGLYTCVDEAGEEVYLTRNEIERFSRSFSALQKVDETLEMLSNKKYDKIYTKDEINFIDESEYKNLCENFPNCEEDYYKCEFIVKE